MTTQWASPPAKIQLALVAPCVQNANRDKTSQNCIPHPPAGEGLIKLVEKAGHRDQRPARRDNPKKSRDYPRSRSRRPEGHRRGSGEFTILDWPQVESVGTRRPEQLMARPRLS